MRSAEQPGQKRNQSDTDERNAASGHELFHALAFCARIVVAVTFQQVDRAPDAKTGTERYDEGLENTDSRIEKCHKICRNPWDGLIFSLAEQQKPE